MSKLTLYKSKINISQAIAQSHALNKKEKDRLMHYAKFMTSKELENLAFVVADV